MTDRLLRILLVDDEELVRAAVRDWLADEQFQIVEATSGTDALALLEQEQFDCCILDLRLRDMSGIEVLTAARQGEKSPVWLIVTGNLDTDAYEELKGLGITDDAILAKPIFDMTVVSARIRQLMGY
jgi:DNA-binding response OmpR family regulator